MLAPNLPPDLLDRLAELARRAGEAILTVYGSDFTVEHKGDDSPVTEADRRAEAVILAELPQLLDGVPVVSEEQAADGHVPEVCAKGRFWLVDPLDGTKEFVRRNGEFTVNIGLVEDGTPLAGVVYAPVTRRMFAGIVGDGAWGQDGDGARRALLVRRWPGAGPSLLDSRSHRAPDALLAFAQQHGVAETRHVGSSLKFGLIAAAEGDVYPRFGPTSEWDTAAGHAVLQAAGGAVLDWQGQPLRYGKPGLRNDGGFVAWGTLP